MGEFRLKWNISTPSILPKENVGLKTGDQFEEAVVIDVERAKILDSFGNVIPNTGRRISSNVFSWLFGKIM